MAATETAPTPAGTSAPGVTPSPTRAAAPEATSTPTPTATPIATPAGTPPQPAATPHATPAATETATSTVSPTPEPVPTPVPLPDPAPGRYTAISVGFFHACALTEEGEAVCWGSNEYGEADVPSGRYLAISAGIVSTCAVGADGELVCWGREMSELPPPGRYRAVSTNGVHACALTEGGEAVCWGGRGWNNFGETEPPPGRYVAISVGFRQGEGPHPANSCALAEDGAVVCWGYGVAEATDGAEAQHLDGHPALRFAGPYSSVVSGAGIGFCAVTIAGEGECRGGWPPFARVAGPFGDAPTRATSVPVGRSSGPVLGRSARAGPTPALSRTLDGRSAQPTH